MKYKVTISREIFYTIEVEHDNEDDAADIADELFQTERHLFDVDRENGNHEVIDIQVIEE